MQVLVGGARGLRFTCIAVGGIRAGAFAILVAAAVDVAARVAAERIRRTATGACSVLVAVAVDVAARCTRPFLRAAAVLQVLRTTGAGWLTQAFAFARPRLARKVLSQRTGRVVFADVPVGGAGTATPSVQAGAAKDVITARARTFGCDGGAFQVLVAAACRLAFASEAITGARRARAPTDAVLVVVTVDIGASAARIAVRGTAYHAT